MTREQIEKTLNTFEGILNDYDSGILDENTVEKEAIKLDAILASLGITVEG